MCCVFNCVCELFGETFSNMFGCCCHFVVECYGVFSVGGGALWDNRVWSSKECACCGCDPSVHLSVPSIGFVYVFVCRMFLPIYEFESWIIGVCSPYVVSLCDFAYYVVR